MPFSPLPPHTPKQAATPYRIETHHSSVPPRLYAHLPSASHCCSVSQQRRRCPQRLTHHHQQHECPERVGDGQACPGCRTGNEGAYKDYPVGIKVRCAMVRRRLLNKREKSGFKRVPWTVVAGLCLCSANTHMCALTRKGRGSMRGEARDIERANRKEERMQRVRMASMQVCVQACAH